MGMHLQRNNTLTDYVEEKNLILGKFTAQNGECLLDVVIFYILAECDIQSVNK